LRESPRLIVAKQGKNTWWYQRNPEKVKRSFVLS